MHSAFGLKFWAFVVGAAPLPPDLEEFWRRLGFAVIQGYGLTETAPIVTLNHPFKTSKGSVGTPIAGVEIRIADDGEILVRGENVTSGYYAPRVPKPKAQSLRPKALTQQRVRQRRLAAHRGHRRARRAGAAVHQGPQEGNDRHAGRTQRLSGRRRARARRAAWGARVRGRRRRSTARRSASTPCSWSTPATDVDAVIREANARLQDHQRIRTSSVWPGTDLPRTEGTRKLKRAAIRDWVRAGGAPVVTPTGDSLESLIARFAHGRAVSGDDDARRAGLELARTRRADGGARGSLSDAHRRGALLGSRERRRSEAARRSAGAAADGVEEPVEFPSWNRTWPVRLVRRLSQATWIVPLTRAFAHARVEGLEHLSDIDGPVVFASNHQSHMDVPVILSALPGRWRARVAPAMAKEFFKAHFFPPSTPGGSGSPTRSTTTWPRSSSTPSRCRSARPARARR